MNVSTWLLTWNTNYSFIGKLEVQNRAYSAKFKRAIRQISADSNLKNNVIKAPGKDSVLAVQFKEKYELSPRQGFLHAHCRISVYHTSKYSAKIDYVYLRREMNKIMGRNCPFDAKKVTRTPDEVDADIDNYINKNAVTI